VITIVSWNVLADAYIRPDYFPHTPAALLEPAVRQPALLERLEMHAASADALCLQEVEPAFFETAARRLEAAFEGRFLQKRSRPDGCCIFVRRALGAPSFHELVFGDGTGHVALAAKLAEVGIATTHLRWQPADVPSETRLGRAELTELCDAWVVPKERWVVTGDLNAEAPSPVLDVAFARGLRDAYASTPDAYTCNSNRRKKRIDFILHSASFDATPAPLPPLTDDTPLPSSDEPSDHLAIRAALRYIKGPASMTR
jgi:endonuclease/exonuclease/phosphatase family metal-dependent hydrolase